MTPYACAICRVTQCKLWRAGVWNQAVPAGAPVELHCCDCAGKLEQRDVSRIGPYGGLPPHFTDCIGKHLPAVPTADGGFWAYHQVPDTLAGWWRELPTRNLTPPTPPTPTKKENHRCPPSP